MVRLTPCCRLKVSKPRCLAKSRHIVVGLALRVDGRGVETYDCNVYMYVISLVPSVLFFRQDETKTIVSAVRPEDHQRRQGGKHKSVCKRRRSS